MKFPWLMSSTCGGSELSLCKIVFIDIRGSFSYILNICSQCPLNPKSSEQRLWFRFRIRKYKAFFWPQQKSISADARTNTYPAWNIFWLFWFNAKKERKKEYSPAKFVDHDNNLRLFSIRCCFSLGVTSFFQKKKEINHKGVLSLEYFICIDKANENIWFLTKRSFGSPRVSSVCLSTRSKCFNMKNWSNMRKCICNQKQTPEISPRTC